MLHLKCLINNDVADVAPFLISITQSVKRVLVEYISLTHGFSRVHPVRGGENLFKQVFPGRGCGSPR
jgi:hypothetical protein